MPDEASIAKFNRELEAAGKELVREAMTAVMRGLAHRALELCVSVTPRRTGRLQSAWFVIEEHPGSIGDRIRNISQIPVISTGAVMARGEGVIGEYDFTRGNVLTVYNGAFYKFAYNAKRPNIEVAVNQVVAEADALIQTFAERVVSAGSRFV